MINFAVCKNQEGVTPEDFKEYLEKWDTYGEEANDTIDKVTKVANDNGVDTMKVSVFAPWPVWYRMMIITRYLELENDDGSVLMLFSSDGNEQTLANAELYTEYDKANYVLATAYCIGS